MRPPNTNPYRLWSCLSVLPNLGNRQRDGQELRREGKRQRDTYEETDELERERGIYIYIYLLLEREGKREGESEKRSGRNEGSTTATLCRHFHESFERTSGCLVGRFLLARPIGRVLLATFIKTHRLIMTVRCHWRRKWRRCVIAALSKIAPGYTVLPYYSPTTPPRLRSVTFGRSRLLH